MNSLRHSSHPLPQRRFPLAGAAFSPNSEVGEHARPRAWLAAPSRPASATRTGARASGKFQARGVFREGAENCARGGRAPHFSSEFSSPSEKRFPKSESSFPLTDLGFPPLENQFPMSGNRFPPPEKPFPHTENGFPEGENAFPMSENAFPMSEIAFPTWGNGFPTWVFRAIPGHFRAPEGENPVTAS